MAVEAADGEIRLQTQSALNNAARSLGFFANQCGVWTEFKSIADGIARLGKPSIAAVVRFADTLGLHFAIMRVGREDLLTLGEPVLAELTGAGVVVVTKLAGDDVVVRGLHTPAAVRLPYAKFEEAWTGTVARLVSYTSLDRIDRRAIWQLVKRFKVAFGSIAALSLLVNALELTLPISFMLIIDAIIAHRRSTAIDLVIIGFVALTTFSGGLSHFSHLLSRKIGERIRMDLISRFTKHILALPVGDFERIKGSEVLSRIAELSVMHRVISNSVAVLWVDLLFVVVCVAIGFYFSHMLGLIMFIRFPVYLAVARATIAKLRKAVGEGQRTRREGNNLILEVLAGIETVKSNHAEQYAANQINRKLSEATETGGDLADFRTAVSRYSVIVDRLAIGAILWIGAHQVISGALTVGQIMAVYLMNRLMTRPINRLAGTIYDTQHALAGLAEINQLLEKQSEANPGRQVRPARLDGAIRFAEVHFRYAADGGEILHGVSFHVRPREVVGIVGPSGSGKSTVIKLIEGLYLPFAGRVEIDGTSTAELDPHWLRERMGVVPQDCWLFNRTIAENIHLGASAVSRAEVVEAARVACAHEFIVRLPKGYETIVGALSGGQRQRIAIARAIVRKPRILLLDESTAALDQETEAAVVKNLESLFKDCTVIIAAHRITTLRHVHRVISLEEGRIVEVGSPGDLLNSGGYFAKMVRDQLSMLGAVCGAAGAGVGDLLKGDLRPDIPHSDVVGNFPLS